MGRTRDDDDSRGSLTRTCLACLGRGLLVAGLGHLLIAGVGLLVTPFLESGAWASNLAGVGMAAGVGSACVLAAYGLREKSEPPEDEYDRRAGTAYEPEEEQDRVLDMKLEAGFLALEKECGTHAARITQRRDHELPGRRA